MAEMKGKYLDRIFESYRRTNEGRSHLEDVQSIRRHLDDNKIATTAGDIKGCTSRRSRMRLAGSIPIKVFEAAMALFPEIPQRKLAKWLLKRYPQYRTQ